MRRFGHPLRRSAVALAVAVVVAGCVGAADTTTVRSEVPGRHSPTIRVALVGDVMLGRGMSPVFVSDPDSVFAEVRHLLKGADIAGANLESPLTERAHVAPTENQLEAAPERAEALAAAGFDVIALANNHTMDAGAQGLIDTMTAIEEAGMGFIGAGVDARGAITPHVVTVESVRIGFIAFDATGVGAPAGTGPGVATWEETTALRAVRALRDDADVVIVSVQGGTEYLPVTDPLMAEIGGRLVEAGADVVWGHGAHVIQPVEVVPGVRPGIVATSLGNFLFDQVGADRTTGALLEVLVGPSGVVAHRVGVTTHPDRRIAFEEWLEPHGSAVWLEGSWWELDGDLGMDPSTRVVPDVFSWGDLMDSAEGDVDGDGSPDIVASFRRPFRSTPFTETHPEIQWQDANGRSAHVGVYAPETLDEVWVAGTVLMPVARLEVCDGAVAVVHDVLDDDGIVGGGAWIWNGFGFDTAPVLPGASVPGCVDVDGDGRSDPVLVERSSAS